MLKKLLSYLLIFAILFPVLGQVHAAPSPTARGIDVSYYQGNIDWDTVAKHIDFAILRCGFGQDFTSQDDKQWYNNVQACTRLKIPFGVYIFSHATTPEQARSEARHALRLLKGYHPSMPVYLDLEDSKIAANCTPAQILENATIFCNMIRDAGYTPGIYANLTWWEKYLTSSQYDKWDRWVARYSDQLNFNKSYSMWQYTAKGSVPGISGNVDMNYWYGKKPTVGCPHNYSGKVKKEPTCTEAGLKVYTCSNCGDSYEQVLPAKGHGYTTQITYPTCTAKGYTTYTCHCGYSYRDHEKPATGHKWDTGVVTVTPTENGKGKKVYTCKSCWITQTVTLPSISSHQKNCPSTGFSDVPSYTNWAHEGIDFVLEKKLFKGMDNGKFSPEGTMTRAMLVTVLWRNAGSPKSGSSHFTDVKDGQWYTNAVAWATKAGIVNGVGNNRFAPNDPVTREQLATILFRYNKVETSYSSDYLQNYPDGSSVSGYAQEAMVWALRRGLINGVLSNNVSYLQPRGTATRGQTATILYRWLYTP